MKRFLFSITIIIVLLLAGVVQNVAFAKDKMYWADSGIKIQRANLDGTDIETLVETEGVNPQKIALDVAGGKMYWTDTFHKKIQRANLDGTDIEDLVTETSGIYAPQDIALDVAGGKMYWTDYHHRKIQRANLDGTDIEDLVTDPSIVLYPSGIDLDVAGGTMYWVDTYNFKIRRANLDGTNIEPIVITVNSYEIALDVAGGKMYWTTPWPTTIQRASLNGTNIETILMEASGLYGPSGIALDVADGKMYWTDSNWSGTAMIRRANLDGTNIEDLVTTGLLQPRSIALALHLDSDGDGIPDDLDVCPNEDARGFDVNADGCIDSSSGLGNIINTLVQEGVISPELETSLLAKVENAEKSATKDNICAAVNQLGALKNQINAQRGNKISDEVADEIIDYADSVIAYLLIQLPAGQTC